MKSLRYSVLIMLLLVLSIRLMAQVGGAFYEGERIQAVIFIFENEPTNATQLKNLEAKVKQAFQIYPQTTALTMMLDSYIGKVKMLPEVASAEYDIQQSGIGGVDLTVTVRFNDKPITKTGKNGVFTGEKHGFPTLYQDNKSLLTLKLSASEMLYSNDDAWYGRKDIMLNGNPLADAEAVSKGYTGWVEGWASGGLYGITPISVKHNLYTYGGVSYIVSGSAGRELFTSRSRFYGGVEDLYLGVVGGHVSKSGNRFVYTASFGRQQFSIGNGFIIRNTASNGDNRAALQLNPRWAAKYLGLFSFRYNNIMFQAFQLQPSELPIINSHTIYQGVNLELGNGVTRQLGMTYIRIPRSESKYYTPTGDIYSRKGLNVYNLRYYSNTPAGVPGLFYKAELGYQTNSNFNMRAYAGYAELGWSFSRSKMSPIVSYRFALFSGDDPKTKTFERWDPLLTGGNGEEWVLGSNHFKIVQNSNVLVHKLQLNFRPTRKIEIVPQAFYFAAARKNNIGGNPALSYMPEHPYGYEVNLTGKYYLSRKWYFHISAAYTIPGSGVREALNNEEHPWFSLMGFFRYSLW